MNAQYRAMTGLANRSLLNDRLIATLSFWNVPNAPRGRGEEAAVAEIVI